MNFILPSTTDRRFEKLGSIARDKGFSVLRESEISPADPAVFILPFTLGDRDCIRALSRIPAGSWVFLGKCSEEAKKLGKQRRIHLTSLLEKDYYLAQNAIHTAEGTLSEIIAKTDYRLDQLCLLVYGYGNCGKAIARLLWLCGCEVWVWSRTRGQALATADGFNLYPAPKKGLGMFDCVINTVPDPIFPPEMLATMREGSFFFQIAGGFSGIDPETAEKIGFHFVPLHALPGKFCPASEADAIWHVVEETLNNRSIL